MRAARLLLCLLVQLRAVLVMDMLEVVVRCQEAHVVHLRPASLLEAQNRGRAPEERLEGG
jgi:hypothetical protein